MTGPHQTTHPRTLSDLGQWRSEDLMIKAYGLCAPGQHITQDMLGLAHHVLETETPPRLRALGDSNGLGFGIVHPGTEGLSIGIYWWAMGSVLCQHIHRQDHDATAPMDTINRPVVACVWELAVIGAEQQAWRRHMMGAHPDPDGYLQDRLTSSTV